MTNGSQVLEMLLPNGGWTIIDNAFDSIIYDDGIKPVTKAAFDAGFAQYDAWKSQQDAKVESDKLAAQAKLAALGLTADDLKALGL
jgi:hypothetical protein